MKSIIINIFCLFLVIGVQAQTGVSFEKGTWEEILATAKKQNKLIFMDAYTTWCGPCKKMSKETFTQGKVGDFYNKNFINVKMDMEKGEGVALANEYKVELYPTLLFLSADGTLVHRTAGYHDADQFIELGNIAIDPARNLGAMKMRYASGDRDPDFLLNYTKASADVMDGSHNAIAAQYMKTQKNWDTPGNQQFIMRYCEDADSKMFDYLTKNRASFVAQFGDQAVVDKIQNIVYQSIYDQPDMTLDQIDRLFEQAYPEKAAELSSKYRMTYYRNRGDRAGFATSAIDHYSIYGAEDATELNDVAWTFYEVIDDPKLLQGGIDLAKQSVKIKADYFNMDTLAALYKKSGNKKKAKKAAKKAIKLAKKSNQDASLTEDLLKEIKKM